MHISTCNFESACLSWIYPQYNIRPVILQAHSLDNLISRALSGHRLQSECPSSQQFIDRKYENVQSINLIPNRRHRHRRFDLTEYLPFSRLVEDGPCHRPHSLLPNPQNPHPHHHRHPGGSSLG